jgi:ammonia channel protein AmtB
MPVTHNVTLTAAAKGKARIDALSIVEFYSKNYRNFALAVSIVVLVTLVSTAIGFVNLFLGVLVGIVLGLACLWLPAWKERQRIERVRT